MSILKFNAWRLHLQQSGREQGSHFVAEHFDDWSGHVGGPHGDHPLSMTYEADSIVGVVAQAVTGAHLGPVLCYSLACASVLHITTQTAGSSDTAACQEDMAMQA